MLKSIKYIRRIQFFTKEKILVIATSLKSKSRALRIQLPNSIQVNNHIHRNIQKGNFKLPALQNKSFEALKDHFYGFKTFLQALRSPLGAKIEPSYVQNLFKPNNLSQKPRFLKISLDGTDFRQFQDTLSQISFDQKVKVIVMLTLKEKQSIGNGIAFKKNPNIQVYLTLKNEEGQISYNDFLISNAEKPPKSWDKVDFLSLQADPISQQLAFNLQFLNQIRYLDIYLQSIKSTQSFYKHIRIPKSLEKLNLVLDSSVFPDDLSINDDTATGSPKAIEALSNSTLLQNFVSELRKSKIKYIYFEAYGEMVPDFRIFRIHAHIFYALLSELKWITITKMRHFEIPEEQILDVQSLIEGCPYRQNLEKISIIYPNLKNLGFLNKLQLPCLRKFQLYGHDFRDSSFRLNFTSFLLRHPDLRTFRCSLVQQFSLENLIKKHENIRRIAFYGQDKLENFITHEDQWRQVPRLKHFEIDSLNSWRIFNQDNNSDSIMFLSRKFLFRCKFSTMSRDYSTYFKKYEIQNKSQKLDTFEGINSEKIQIESMFGFNMNELHQKMQESLLEALMQQEEEEKEDDDQNQEEN